MKHKTVVVWVIWGFLKSNVEQHTSVEVKFFCLEKKWFINYCDIKPCERYCIERWHMNNMYMCVIFFYNSCRNQPYFDRVSLNIFFRQAVSFLLKFLFYSLEPKYLLQFERNNQVFNMKHLFPRFIILYQYMFDLWNNRSLIFQSVKNQGIEVPLSLFIVLLVFSLYTSRFPF